MSGKENNKIISAYEALVMHTGFTDPILAEELKDDGDVELVRLHPTTIIEDISRFMVINFADIQDDLPYHLPLIQETFRRRQMSLFGMFQNIDPTAFEKLSAVNREAALDLFRQTHFDFMARFGDEFCIESDMMKPDPRPKPAQVLSFTRPPSGADALRPAL